MTTRRTRSAGLEGLGAAPAVGGGGGIAEGGAAVAATELAEAAI
jgi:hypothetical protein